jgi:hypothetical protein
VSRIVVCCCVRIAVRAGVWVGVCCLSSGELFDDPRFETRVGVTIYNKNYKRVVLRVH